MRHRRTVEQYGVRVEIPTEAHKISHGSARSSLTGYSWPCANLTIHVGCQYAEWEIILSLSVCPLHAPHHCPAKLPTPSWEEQTLVSDMQRRESLAGMHGRVPTWHLTGRRSTGEPLVWPVKASPSCCPSRRPPSFGAFWPAGREIGVVAPAPKSRANE